MSGWCGFVVFILSETQGFKVTSSLLVDLVTVVLVLGIGILDSHGYLSFAFEMGLFVWSIPGRQQYG